MKRAGFTVFMEGNPHGMSANHLHTTQKSVVGGDGEVVGSISILNFVCSGQAISLEASKARVEYNQTGIGYCSECDASLHDVVGAGVHSEEGYHKWLQFEADKTFKSLSAVEDPED